MTRQRRSKGKASTTVTVAANMATTIKKDQFLANQKNKQQFIFLLSAELEKIAATLAMQLEMLIFWLFRKLFNLLPLVKLCSLVKTLTSLYYFAIMQILIPMTYSFALKKQKKTKKSLCLEYQRPQKKSLVKTSAATSSSSTLFLGEIQHHVFMGLEKEQP